MVSKNITKFCNSCGKRTTHYVEKNKETGWHRERCENWRECENIETISEHNVKQ